MLRQRKKKKKSLSKTPARAEHVPKPSKTRVVRSGDHLHTEAHGTGTDEWVTTTKDNRVDTHVHQRNLHSSGVSRVEGRRGILVRPLALLRSETQIPRAGMIGRSYREAPAVIGGARVTTAPTISR